jgi:hypothetical protein
MASKRDIQYKQRKIQSPSSRNVVIYTYHQQIAKLRERSEILPSRGESSRQAVVEIQTETEELVNKYESVVSAFSSTYCTVYIRCTFTIYTSFLDEAWPRKLVHWKIQAKMIGCIRLIRPESSMVLSLDFS